MFTPNQYPVSLDAEQRQRLEDLTRNGHAPAKNIQHARILLLSDRQQPGGHCTDPDIAHLLGMHVNTVARIRKQFVLQGQAPALDRKPRQNPPSRPRSMAKWRPTSSPCAASHRRRAMPAGLSPCWSRS